MNTVRQLLQDKDREVLSIEPNKSVYNAMQLMAAKKIGALPVLEAGCGRLWPNLIINPVLKLMC